MGLPVAFDFSNRWTDEYLKKICPHVKVAMLSCAHLSDKEREREMSKVKELGVPLVLGTIGEAGSYILYHGEMMYEKADKGRKHYGYYGRRRLLFRDIFDIYFAA